MQQRTYIAIDLKSFYASVECRERGLDPMDTNLVVADESRTNKTICLAVTPTLKSYGISGRSRLFEVRQRVKEVNAKRQWTAPEQRLEGTSYLQSELQANPKRDPREFCVKANSRHPFRQECEQKPQADGKDVLIWKRPRMNC